MTAQTILPANTLSSGDLVTNSLRFDSASSDYLNRTTGTATSTTKMTFSTWVKRSSIATSVALFSFKTDGNNELYFRFMANDTLQVYSQKGGTKIIERKTNRVFRDNSAWYHLVLQIDTTHGTVANRIRIYVNGVQETSFSASTNPDQNETITYVASATFEIGRKATSTNIHMDGYLAETVFLDGLDHASSFFGEFDSDSGIWTPINVSGFTFGNNGFYLQYKEAGTDADASGMGADTSGETNHFTVNNLTAVDQTTDTPQNNYCTINAVFADDGNNLIQADFSEGNVKMLSTVDGWKFGRGTFLLDAGKWYVEVKATETGNGENGRFGIVPSEGGITLGNGDDNDVFEGLTVGLGGSDTNLEKLDTGSGTAIFSNFASTNIAMLAIDLDNNKIWVGREGTWYNNNNASTTLSSSNHDIALPAVNNGWVFALGIPRNGNDNISFEYNWGNPSFAVSSSNADADGHGNFEFAVPSGFFAVNSKNLAEYG